MKLTIDQMLQKAFTARKVGKLDDAVVYYKKVIELKPDYTAVYYNLGNTLYVLKKLDEAVISFRTVTNLKPDYVEAYRSLGAILCELGKLDEAEVSYKKAIDLKPDFPAVYVNLGSILEQLKKFREAEETYKKALELQPNFMEAHYNLGNLMRITGRLNEALGSYKKAVELKSDFSEGLNNLAIVQSDLGRLNEAEVSYKKAIQLKPNNADTYTNLAITQYHQKKLEESSENYDRALILKPDLDYLLCACLHAKMHLCNWDNFSSDLLQLTKKINNGEKVAAPFHLLSLIDDPGIHRKASEITSNNMFPKLEIFSKILPYHNHKKIKIGYFSPDFKNHPVSYLTAELYEIHDRKKFEIHAFSFGPDTKDEFNIRIKAGVDYFHDVQMMSNLDIVKLARSLEVDIAIDLAGFTGLSRTNIFAMSAAPIQVNYLGYTGTMAANYYDYYISDKNIITEKNKKYSSEKIVYMPNTYLVDISKKKISETKLSRDEMGLPNTGFVFCCFNNNWKITPTTFAGWMRILLKVEGSVLWLTGGNNTAMNNLKKEARKNGIDEDRLIFAQHKPHEEHLKRIQLADLFLDTLPYNAHITASDALRMGVPVLTCTGNSFASRVATSLLKSVNLPEMITTTQEQYESLAIELAKNAEKLKTIEDKLKNNLPKAPLYNNSLYTRHIEAAYLAMYERYQNKLNIEDIEIDH